MSPQVAEIIRDRLHKILASDLFSEAELADGIALLPEDEQEKLWQAAARAGIR